jgi:hypothetical protein
MNGFFLSLNLFHPSGIIFKIPLMLFVTHRLILHSIHNLTTSIPVKFRPTLFIIHRPILHPIPNLIHCIPLNFHSTPFHSISLSHKQNSI